MLNLLKTLFFIATLLFSFSAVSFEVDEFQSGMGKDKVKELLNNWKFDRIQEFSGNTVVAYDLPEKESYRQFTFAFCNEKLVGFEQAIKPEIKNFILMSSNYNKRYGQPVKIDASNNVISIGEKNQLAIYWRNAGDLIGLKIILLPPNDQIIALHESPNTCWKIPR